MEKPSWYPQDKNKLNSVLDELLEAQGDEKRIAPKKINGLIVPHAGYFFSGKIAGKAFGLLKDKNIEKAIVFGPSHQLGFYGIALIPKIETPLGPVKIIKNNIKEIPGLNYEHSVDNQIPLLQKIRINKITPIVVGKILENDPKKIAENISKIIDNKTILIFSTDLSHFLNYDKALKKDKETIDIIKNLKFEKFEEIDACGKNPLLIMMHLCKLKNWTPNLIEYKNSGDVTGEKNSVVGYATFYF